MYVYVHGRQYTAAGAVETPGDPRGRSVSAWMTDAARLALKIRGGLAAVAEWEAEHGALTGAELKAARQRLVSSRRPRRTLRP